MEHGRTIPGKANMIRVCQRTLTRDKISGSVPEIGGLDWCLVIGWFPMYPQKEPFESKPPTKPQNITNPNGAYPQNGAPIASLDNHQIRKEEGNTHHTDTHHTDTQTHTTQTHRHTDTQTHRHTDDTTCVFLVNLSASMVMPLGSGYLI